MPVERIFTFIRDNGPHTMPEIAEALKLEKSDVGSAFGLLSKSGVTRLNGERKAEIAKDELPREVVVQSSLLKKAVEKGFLEEDQLSEEEKAAISQMAKKRGASSSPFKYVEREEITYALTDKGESVKEAVLEANITGEEFGVLTAEMLASGSWKNGSFRPYGINAPTSRLFLDVTMPMETISSGSRISLLPWASKSSTVHLWRMSSGMETHFSCLSSTLPVTSTMYTT